MPDLSRFINRNRKRVSDRFLRFRKAAYQFCTIRNPSPNKTILFIFGCQRSGTTLLTEIFERDFDNTQVYGEFSRLSSTDRMHHIRLNPLHLVKIQIDNSRPPLIILKPLVESQNALRLLDYFTNSKALWVYRHYRDVALSNLKLWGINNGINNLRPIVEGKPHNWRSDQVSESTKRIVAHFFSETMNPYDAAALFWFVRNNLFFELNLDKDIRVKTSKYEDLINEPKKIMDAIYAFLGYSFPASKVDINISRNSVGSGMNINLSKDIEDLCHDTLEKLDLAHTLKQRQTV